MLSTLASLHFYRIPSTQEASPDRLARSNIAPHDLQQPDKLFDPLLRSDTQNIPFLKGLAGLDITQFDSAKNDAIQAPICADNELYSPPPLDHNTSQVFLAKIGDHQKRRELLLLHEDMLELLEYREAFPHFLTKYLREVL